MDGPEYRDKLLAHAKLRGYEAPAWEGNSWTFEAGPGVDAVLEYEPILTEKSGYLIYAKGILTSQKNRFRPPSIQKPGKEVPSKIRGERWLHAFAPGGVEPVAELEAGKWMMFIAEQFVDDTWKNVRRAVLEQDLAYYAKISTKAAQVGMGPYVLCVYIPDYRNRDEAMALRERLRILGFKRRIHFKRDSMTLAGINGSEFSA